MRRNYAEAKSGFGFSSKMYPNTPFAQAPLIDDLLDLSRIMTGKLRLDLHQVSFTNIVQAAIDSVRPTADAKSIRLKAVLGASQDIINADSGRLQQVVWNLLTNAIKFTPKG